MNAFVLVAEAPDARAGTIILTYDAAMAGVTNAGYSLILIAFSIYAGAYGIRCLVDVNSRHSSVPSGVAYRSHAFSLLAFTKYAGAIPMAYPGYSWACGIFAINTSATDRT
jgi:hypothetical protein